jgi:hypothetical protein
MKAFFAVLLFLLLPELSLALDEVLMDGTSWNVGVYENGKRGAVHPVPWEFQSNGTVSAGRLWKGVWQRKDENTVSVVITHQNKSTDQFEVNFLSPRQFVAFKNGQPYRYGQRR